MGAWAGEKKARPTGVFPAGCVFWSAPCYRPAWRLRNWLGEMPYSRLKARKKVE